MFRLSMFVLLVVASSSVGQPLVSRPTLHVHWAEKGTVAIYATKMDVRRFKMDHPKLKTSFTSVANVVTDIGGVIHYSSNYGPKWTVGDRVNVFVEVQFISGRRRWVSLGQRKVVKFGAVERAK